MFRTSIEYSGKRIPDAIRLSDLGIIEAYKQLRLPPVPVVHPYNPEAEEGGGVRKNYGMPIFSVAGTLPNRGAEYWPAGVVGQLASVGISPEKLELFFCVQDMPWKENIALLLRPHSWIHHDAPLRQSGYSRTANMIAGVFDLNGSVDRLVNVGGVCTHSGDSGFMVYSSAQMPISGVQDRKKTHCFYSLSLDPASKKAALTFHWLLNDSDHDKVQQVLKTANSLDAFMTEVERFSGSQLNGTLGEAILTPLASLKTILTGKRSIPSENMPVYRLAEQGRPDVAKQKALKEEVEREQAGPREKEGGGSDDPAVKRQAEEVERREAEQKAREELERQLQEQRERDAAAKRHVEESERREAEKKAREALEREQREREESRRRTELERQERERIAREALERGREEEARAQRTREVEAAQRIEAARRQAELEREERERIAREALERGREEEARSRRQEVVQSTVVPSVAVQHQNSIGTKTRNRY